MTGDFDEGIEEMRQVLRPAVLAYLEDMVAHFQRNPMTHSLVHTERARLRALWSAWLTDYTVAVGPTWTCTPWPIDSDLDPETGAETFVRTVRFIAPGNVLGIPSVALPTGVADGLATGIQVYAELYREDLCLAAAEAIEAECDVPTPIEPR